MLCRMPGARHKWMTEKQLTKNGRSWFGKATFPKGSPQLLVDRISTSATVPLILAKDEHRFSRMFLLEVLKPQSARRTQRKVPRDVYLPHSLWLHSFRLNSGFRWMLVACGNSRKVHNSAHGPAVGLKRFELKFHNRRKNETE